MTKTALTAEQEDIVKASKELTSGQTLKIDACAGSGKTATLVEVAKASPDKTFLYLAFNKAIVEEAKKRFPENVQIKTTHSLAYSHTMKCYSNKGTIVSRLSVYDLVPLFGKINSSNWSSLSSLIQQYLDYLHSDEQACPSEDVERLFAGVESGKLPLTHDHYLKKYQLQRQHPELDAYDVILLDEAQDINYVTRSIFLDNQCNKILVGDSHQSIYAFRGSANILKTFNADRTFYLSHCFRCSAEICDRANYFLSKYADDKDSFVTMKSAYKGCDDDSCGLLSRTNASLIEEIAQLSERKSKHVKLIRQPELLFKTCFNVLKLKQHNYNFDKEYSYFKQFESLSHLIEYANECCDRELLLSINLVKHYHNELYDIFRVARRLYDNERDEIDTYFSTAHSAKGLEFDSVKLCEDFPSLKKIFNQGKQLTSEESENFQQELNLYYVSVTRAKNKITDLSENNEDYET